MAKSIYQKFLDFKVRHNLDNETIAKIAIEYANSNLELARTHFTDKYNITQHIFYKIRDYAVIFCLIDDSICKKLLAKASENYSKNNEKNSSVAPIAHFDDLLIERQKFLNGFSPNEIRDIGNKYVEGMSVENIAKAYDTGPFAIQRLLKKGIIMLIFDSDTVNQISVIAKGNTESILQKRKTNKKFLLDCYQAEILSLNLQIKNYDLLMNPKPTIEDLKENLQNATKMYNEALQL